MYSFDYHRPNSVADAVKLLAEHEEAKILAGGQTLLPTLKMRLAQPSDLIDLGGIAELRGIKVTAGAVSIGATTRHVEVAFSPEVGKAIPALAKLAGGIGDPQVRNMGTIGGSLANSDPAADYPAAVLGLGASLQTNKRTIAADKFFTGMFETALEPGEILTRIEFPVPEKAAYVKFANPASRYAIVGVFVAKTASGVRVAVTGASGSVFRWTAAEKALGGSLAASALASLKADAKGLNADIHASAEYRAHLIGVMTQRAVAAL